MESIILYEVSWLFNVLWRHLYPRNFDGPLSSGPQHLNIIAMRPTSQKSEKNETKRKSLFEVGGHASIASKMKIWA